MRWKNPLSSGLKRSIETLPDRVMQGFGVGMEISRMRAAREQAAQDRANEAARYRQETARRAQERQQDLDWRTGQAKTSGDQWAAEQALRQQAFDAQQAREDYDRQAREAAAAREAEYGPSEEARKAETHRANLALLQAKARREAAGAGLYGAQAGQLRKGRQLSNQQVEQFRAMTQYSNALAERLKQLDEAAADPNTASYQEVERLYAQSLSDLESMSKTFGATPSFPGPSFDGEN